MSNTQYVDPVLKKYADIIRAGNKEIKMVFFGDPIRLGVSSLPALIMAKVDTTIENLTNVDDRHRMRISITLVTDVRDTISEDNAMVPGVNALYNLMEGREADTYVLKADSLLNIIRSNVELDVAHNLRTDLDSMTRVEYSLTAGKRSEGGWSVEGMLELTATFTQLR